MEGEEEKVEAKWPAKCVEASSTFAECTREGSKLITKAGYTWEWTYQVKHNGFFDPFLSFWPCHCIVPKHLLSRKLCGVRAFQVT